MPTRNAVLALRMQRQFFTAPAGPAEYDAFFRDISPVPTIGWCEPGQPPTLPPHAGFDDHSYNFRRRAGRGILKGRFGGMVAYVDVQDWELYASLYCKPLPRPTLEQARLLDLLEREGPLNIGLIKEITGLKSKEITPMLHRLQEAFLVFEDQSDNGGDRGWYVFSSEFPDVDPGRYTKQEALMRVLPRFAYRQVFFTADMAKCFYRRTIKEAAAALDALTADGTLVQTVVDGESGYMLPDDIELEDAAPPRGVIAVQRNDFLVKSQDAALKKRFSSPYEHMYYLLIDGEIRGAVCGRFRFGPHDLEDVVLDLPPEERAARREEIIEAVYTVFDRAGSPLKRYDGKEG